MPKRALFFAGGWEGHTPVESARIFAGLLSSVNYEVEISESLEVLLDREKLNQLDLIVPVWSTGVMTEDQERGLVAAVRNGAGIAGWHGTLADAFRSSVDYQFMVGGQWVAHPGGMCDYTVRITDRTHPITQGIVDFRLHSEQYYLHVDPGIQVLAATTFSGEVLPWIDGVDMPVVWTKMWGRGRVAYCSLGHEAREFQQPEVRELVLRCLLWAGEGRRSY